MSNFKKILTLMLALALALCVTLAFTACGTPDDEGDDECTNHTDANADGVCDTEGCGASVPVEPTGTTYTVTVVDEDGNAVPGVVLTIGTTTIKSGDLTTDAQGKASATLNITGVAKVRATVKSVPAGYKSPESAEMFEQGAVALTVTIEEENMVEHTVKLVDENGEAIALAGAEIMICQSVCQTAVPTDANGVAKITFEPEASYLKVKIANIEELDYTYADTVDGEGYVHYDEGTTVIELVLKAK